MSRGREHSQKERRSGGAGVWSDIRVFKSRVSNYSGCSAKPLMLPMQPSLIFHWHSKISSLFGFVLPLFFLQKLLFNHSCFLLKFCFWAKLHSTRVQNNQEFRRQYWVTDSFVCSFAHTAYSLTCFVLLALLVRCAALRCAHSFAHSLLSSLESEKYYPSYRLLWTMVHSKKHSRRLNFLTFFAASSSYFFFFFPFFLRSFFF